MELLAVNLSGLVRQEKLYGRDFLVAPVKMLREGVLHGSNGALFYPAEEIDNSQDAWNGMPIVGYHPIRNGQRISARSADILNEQGLGIVLEAKSDNGELGAEAWFDIENTQKFDRRFGTDILERVRRGEPIEVSTGLYTKNEPAQNGASYQGKSYEAIARHHRPDHLAVLPTGAFGACSNKDGCGINLNVEGSLLDKLAQGFARTDEIKTDNAKPSSGIPPSKACKILADGVIRGKPLTEKQKGMFGAACGQMTHQEAEEETYNRDWPQSRRNKLPTKDFAGPNQSFPIQTQEDVDAAVHSLGRTKYDREAIKRRIKVIAKRKGLTLPDTWTTNQRGKDMPMTQEERQKTIDKLIANSCGCWEAEDAEVLNSFDDVRLQRLVDAQKKTSDRDQKIQEYEKVVNTVKKGFRAGNSQFTFNAATNTFEQEVDEEEEPQDNEDYMAPPMEVVKKKTRRTKPQTTNEWLREAPKEVQNTFRNAMNLEKKERNRLISQLTANMDDEDRKERIANKFQDKSLEELQDMLELLPPAPPAENELEVNWLGAAVPPSITRQDEECKSDILPLPTMNWGHTAAQGG